MFYTLLTGLFWLAVWQIASMVINQPLFMPSPAQTIASLISLASTQDFWLSIAFTFYRVIAGLVISFVLGIALALDRKSVV